MNLANLYCPASAAAPSSGLPYRRSYSSRIASIPTGSFSTIARLARMISNSRLSLRSAAWRNSICVRNATSRVCATNLDDGSAGAGDGGRAGTLGSSGSFFFGGSAFCWVLGGLAVLLADGAGAGGLPTDSFGLALGDAMGGPCLCCWW